MALRLIYIEFQEVQTLGLAVIGRRVLGADIAVSLSVCIRGQIGGFLGDVGGSLVGIKN